MTRSLSEVAIFACVGLAASLVHFLVAVGLIENLSMPAWQANIAAFMCALPISYFGHALLTFSAKHYNRATRVSVQTLQKFMITALGGFALNQFSVVVLISWLGLPHRPVMFFTVFGIAGLLFLAGKFWAFRGSAVAGSGAPAFSGRNFKALTIKAFAAFDAQLLTSPRTVSDKTERFVFLAILALGAVLRFVTLGHDSLWVDEGYTLGVTRFSFGHLWTVPFDIHPPLYYSLAKLSLLFGESEFALRSSTALASALTLIPFYMLARALMGRTGALVAIAILAMSFTNLVYASDARNYGLLGLFFMISAAALHRLVVVLRGHRKLRARAILLPLAIYTFGAAGALYSHNSAVVYLFAVNAAWCLYALVRSPVQGFGLSLRLGVLNAPALLMWVPWLAVITSTTGDFGWLEQASPVKALQIYLITLLPNGIIAPGLIAFLAIIGAGSVIVVRRGGDLAVVVGLNLIAFPLAVWLFGFGYTPIYMERVILPVIYGGALAVGAIAAFLRHQKLALGLGLLALILTACSAITFLFRSPQLDHLGGHEMMNMRGALENIEPRPDNAIILCVFFSYPTAEFYAPGVDTYVELSDGSFAPVTRDAWDGVFQMRNADRVDPALEFIEQSRAADAKLLTMNELAQRYTEVHVVDARLFCEGLLPGPLSEKLESEGFADVTTKTYGGVIARKFIRKDAP